jgi:hypothetical protein
MREEKGGSQPTMDLIPLPFEERVSLDGEKKAKIER